ncbi:MAG TPA: HAD family phosphatase [Dehalococcoidia bacterium]|nr:HAD family phosphatase [Dehalococcoidia bacterium]
MYRGIIFDLDGVIRHWGDEHLRAAEQRYQVPRNLILEATFHCPAFDEALVGRLPAEAWHAAAREALCAMVGREVGGAVDDFVAFPGWIDRSMLDLADRLRLKLRVGLLSNGTTRLEEHLALHDLSPHFDDVVNTARIGVAKPDAQAYLIAAHRLGVSPAGCLFVDDRKSNIEGAQSAGLTGIHFQGVAQLESELAILLDEV